MKAVSDAPRGIVKTYAYFFPSTHMATIHTSSPVVEERHVVHSDDDASSAGMIAVLLIAAVLIIGFLLFAMQAFPFNAGTAGSNMDINLPDVNVPAPDVVPDVDVNQNNTTPVNPAE